VKTLNDRKTRVEIRLNDWDWSRYLLTSDPKALRDDFGDRRDAKGNAIVFLNACKNEAERVLKKYPLPPGPSGRRDDDISEIFYLSEHADLERLSTAQKNAVEVLRLAFSLECIIERPPWNEEEFLNEQDAGEVVLNTMALTAALIRGNFFETLWPRVQAAGRREHQLNGKREAEEARRRQHVRQIKDEKAHLEAGQIKSALKQYGISVSKRTVERDLRALGYTQQSTTTTTTK
jgi:hypothetical protein